MKKTSLYLASIFICGTALAGNAPENTESKSFSFGGNAIMAQMRSPVGLLPEVGLWQRAAS